MIIERTMGREAKNFKLRQSETITIVLLIIAILIISCNENKEVSSMNPENWSKRSAVINTEDSLEFGKSYLSIYSQIYSLSEHKTHNLTAMVSLRNTSDSDTIYILKAEYYDTHGKSIRKYFDNPIFLAPMETTEIIIDEIDTSGGTGSNFIFEWNIPQNSPEPLFEGIMSSTMSQQGLSFTTHAVRVK
ncbi:DUF3124 domain-containing protein [Leeuwenhoekiella sp. A16]|uniref:DUF3124 domain-containing protein n=1 Tax=unclassified Leeuwenhoekiella TaxID=2615029 RepID=UPI003A80BEF7|tara:strand:- start:2428 stop:2994 length:567 start_codon:yes stop_codon:yes gene_type:complete